FHYAVNSPGVHILAELAYIPYNFYFASRATVLVDNCVRKVSDGFIIPRQTNLVIIPDTPTQPIARVLPDLMYSTLNRCNVTIPRTYLDARNIMEISTLNK
ncbi:unnamed protein product, partial [Medioppia subpectinata]